MDSDLQRVKIKLKEDAGRAAVVVESASVVGYAVLVRVEGL